MNDTQLQLTAAVHEVSTLNKTMIEYLDDCVNTQTLPSAQGALDEFEKLAILLKINDHLLGRLFEENAQFMEELQARVNKLESRQ